MPAKPTTSLADRRAAWTLRHLLSLTNLSIRDLTPYRPLPPDLKKVVRDAPPEVLHQLLLECLSELSSRPYP